MIFNNLLPFKLSGVHRQHVSDGTVRYGCDRLVFKRRSTFDVRCKNPNLVSFHRQIVMMRIHGSGEVRLGRGSAPFQRRSTIEAKTPMQLGSPMHGEYTTGHKDTKQTIPCFE